MFYLNLPLLSEENFKDRFDLQKFLEMTENVYDFLDSYFVLKIKNLTQHGVTTVFGEEFRPDLLSYRIYDTVNFWYILLLYNDKISPFELMEGDVINYPRIDEVEELYFSLNALQKNELIRGQV